MGKKIRIDPGWDNYKDLTFAPAVRKGNMLFITGMDSSQIDPETGALIRGADHLDRAPVTQHDSLRSGLFVTAGAVDLAGKEKTRDFFCFEIDL